MPTTQEKELYDLRMGRIVKAMFHSILCDQPEQFKNCERIRALDMILIDGDLVEVELSVKKSADQHSPAARELREKFVLPPLPQGPEQ